MEYKDGIMQLISIKQKMIKNIIHQMKVEAEAQIMYLAKDDHVWASKCAERLIRYGNEINVVKGQIEQLELVILKLDTITGDK